MLQVIGSAHFQLYGANIARVFQLEIVKDGPVARTFYCFAHTNLQVAGLSKGINDLVVLVLPLLVEGRIGIVHTIRIGVGVKSIGRVSIKRHYLSMRIVDVKFGQQLFCAILERIGIPTVTVEALTRKDIGSGRHVLQHLIVVKGLVPLLGQFAISCGKCGTLPSCSHIVCSR